MIQHQEIWNHVKKKKSQVNEWSLHNNHTSSLFMFPFQTGETRGTLCRQMIIYNRAVLFIYCKDQWNITKTCRWSRRRRQWLGSALFLEEKFVQMSVSFVQMKTHFTLRQLPAGKSLEETRSVRGITDRLRTICAPRDLGRDLHTSFHSVRLSVWWIINRS